MNESQVTRKNLWDGKERRKYNTQKSQRHANVIATVRSTREKLTSESGLSKAFDCEILSAFARNYRSTIFVLVGLTLLMAIFGLTWMNYFGIVLWLSCNLSFQAFTYYRYRKFLENPPQNIKNIRRAHNSFIRLTLINGLIWTSYILIPVTEPSLSQPVFTFTTILMVIAVYSFIAAPIFPAMLSATIPITIVFMLKYTIYGYTSMVMMSFLILSAQLMFTFMARQIRNTLVTMLIIREEKDNLILDLEEATSQSDESRRRAEQANLAKSRFLATMSHELRTPLNAILGFSDIMKQELLGPLDNKSYKEYVEDIHNSGDHLLNLINEILDLSRIEAGRYELNEEPLVLCHIVEDCHSLIQIRARKKEITINTSTEENMQRLWADERAIRQITLNLLSNAIKFTPQGGEINIAVGWTAGGGQYISISDNGPGIPEEEIPIVLSQFGQGSLAIKSAEQGTGLGLPICQALISMHGGALDFKSKLRVGTTVTITFPRVRVMEALPPVREALTSQQAPQQVNLKSA